MRLTKMVYLNVDSLPERAAWMEAGFNQIGVPADRWERFPGVDGADYPSYDALLADMPPFMSKVRGTWLEGQRGTTALHYSHYLLYQSVAAVADDECVLVLHDDCRPCRPFNDYVQLAADLPNFDFVQLMRWEYAQGNLDEPHIRAMLSRVSEMPAFRSCVVRPDFVYGTRGPGDQAMVCSAQGARKLCAFIEETPSFSIEHVFVDMSFEWRVLSPVSPPSCGQNPLAWTEVMQHREFSHPFSYRQFVDGDES